MPLAYDDQAVLRDIQALAKHLLQTLEAWLALQSEGPLALTHYTPNVQAAYNRIKSGFGTSPDVLLRWLQVPACAPEKVLIASIDGLSDTQMVDQDIVAPLLTTHEDPASWGENTLTPGHIHAEDSWDTIIRALAAGNTLIFAPGFPKVWIVDTVTYKQRAISRPQTEIGVRGPEDAFNEVLLTQMNQLRQRLLDPSLRFHQMVLGERQHTPVAIAYLDGLTNPALVETGIARLEQVKISGRANATMISGLIRDHPRSIFPTMRSTERVDVACWRLLEGKILILVDGDPFVLIAPAPLADFYRTSMDYAEVWYDSSFVRIIRLLGWILGVYFPALYIALTQVNTNLVPAPLLAITLGSHAALPFSPFAEAVLMVIIIEILREASLRLPKPMGTTIGIIGAIVVGTAVVKAGFVSPQIIVIITLTALSFYTGPVYDLTGSWRLINMALLVTADIFGIFGIVLLTMTLIGSLIQMTSFGTPYFVPYAPFRIKDFKDYLVRAPYDMLRQRPSSARPLNTVLSRHGSVQEIPHLRQTQKERP
ncbi:spore germination protein [Sulfobacillus thermotolerans]|uniref:Spore germination protein n=1 Tax=Sulfobacillus thermotolerans TaxID=338644 RepID=A0ABN5GWF5_9FIRM|nr:spore germination protein [Sulfobacillus thermotolerans]